MTAGGGSTYPEVVRLLKEKVAQKGQRTVSRESGIALLSIQRYLKGQGEPTTATLQKLADYFEVDIHELRNNQDCILEFSNGYKVGLSYNMLVLNGMEMALLFDPKTTEDEFNAGLSIIIGRYLRDLPGEPFTSGQEKILTLFEQYRRDTRIISG